MARIIRVFPRRTKATPTDSLAVVGREPELFDEADEVHISVTFTWDLPAAERLAAAWKHVAPVKVGGPATGMRGEAFTPGMYLRHGYTVTSRGCPERCWFCQAWKRDGDSTRELDVRDGWNVLDDNLLACSRLHFVEVIEMLREQDRRAEFTGGLHAARLTEWHVGMLASLHPRPAIFLAYDEERDLAPFRAACAALLEAGWTTASHRLRCYVLAGFPKDTLAAAERRCRQVIEAGATPMAMVYRGPDGRHPGERWAHWQKRWARPAIIHARSKK